MTRSIVAARSMDSSCPIARSVSVLSDPWSFLLLREALLGRRTFAQFRDALGIATDVLSARLATLVEHGIMERTPYREPGQRTRDAYTLTPAGEELKTVLVALQEWGTQHMPSEKPSRVRALTRASRQPVHVGFIDDDGRKIAQDAVEFVRIENPSPVERRP
ncbi:helix-turn-helix domain-containing protein [Microbacterium sp. NPDC089189]|uniref:winged helix-turn-helix transcriptional regulator n=1 Tax=Microbacterium sp. NPDC089189 TaxID=3154972 RepID=UPI00342E551E